MTYDIFGWVEMTAQSNDIATWQGVINLGDVAGHPNEVSVCLFGLSKWSRLQPSPAFAERGLPLNLSSEARAEVQDILDMTAREREKLGFHGFSHATLAEIKKISIPSGTSWDLLLEETAKIQRMRQCSDSQVRFVVWALW